jgi:phenylalanyl-tRNA synthetase beta chain
LNEILAFVKGDVESLDGDAVSIEVKDSNRPDIWSVEGIARALRNQLEVSDRRQIIVTGRSSLRVVIDKRVEPIRPFISTAIVKGLKPSEEALKSWISLQEKLDLTYGRKRKRASIGLYQADIVASPLSYTVADPEQTSFVPLGSDAKSTLRQIVNNHPKGSEYGGIISHFDEWPILIDGKDRILSLPPVINSNDLGRITEDTRNVLVEVTGTDAETVHNTLKVMISSLAERGGRIYSCIETYTNGTRRRVESPDLRPKPAKLSLSYLNKLLGTKLNHTEAARSAKKAGYKVQRSSGDTLRLAIPCYRIDIMHPVDIVEDIAIAQDLNKLKPEWPRIWTIGDLSRETYQTETIDEIMIGLGYQEVLTYVLTSPEVVDERGQTKTENLVTLLNPKLTTHTVLRNSLLPSLLEFLSHNTHVDYPQRIFEVGASVSRGERREQAREERKVSALTIHAEAGFTEIRSALDALTQNLGQTLEIESTTNPTFLTGRCGRIMSEGQEVGIVGEINPKILQAWGLNLPAAAFELNISQKTTQGA